MTENNNTYMLVQDCFGFLFVIPATKKEEWREREISGKDLEGPPPDWATIIPQISYLKFENWRIVRDAK